MLPSAASPTTHPKSGSCPGLPPVSFACWLHDPAARVNTNAPSPNDAPSNAVLPSEARASLFPAPEKSDAVGVSLPCWLHAVPDRVKTHAAPTCVFATSGLRDSWSDSPPINAVLPSRDRATLEPKRAPASPVVPPSMSFSPCCVHVEPDRVKTHAAPGQMNADFSALNSPLSHLAPMSAVFPSPDSAALFPKPPLPTSPLPFRASPCWDQTDPDLVKTHAVSSLPAPSPPTRAVLPSADSATLAPKPVTVPLGVSEACFVHVAPERVNTETVSPPPSANPAISAVFPSPDRATARPNTTLLASVSFSPCCTNGSMRTG